MSSRAKGVSLVIILLSFLCVGYLTYLCATADSICYNNPVDYFSDIPGMIMVLVPVIVSIVFSIITGKIYWLFSMLAFVIFMFIPHFVEGIETSPKSIAFICYGGLCFALCLLSVLVESKVSEGKGYVFLLGLSILLLLAFITFLVLSIVYGFETEDDNLTVYSSCLFISFGINAILSFTLNCVHKESAGQLKWIFLAIIPGVGPFIFAGLCMGSVVFAGMLVNERSYGHKKSPKRSTSSSSSSSYSSSHSSSSASSSSSSSSRSSSSSSSSYSSGGYSSSYGSSNEERSFTQGGSTGCGIGGSFCGCGSGR